MSRPRSQKYRITRGRALWWVHEPGSRGHILPFSTYSYALAYVRDELNKRAWRSRHGL